MKHIFYFYAITVLVVSACSSGKSTFERGNYYEAVITSVNRLRKNSDHKKSVETLRQAYPMAVRFYEDRANTAIASAESFRWTQVVNSYTTINYMYDEIKRCPGALRVIPNPVNYAAKLHEARQNAAEEHYAAGIVALQFGEREKAKQAYGNFKTANEFISGYKDVISYMEAALNAATVKILVEPIPVHSRTVGVSAEFFNDKISEFVHSAPINEFARFYTRAEAETLKLNPDQIIQLQFDDFAVGQVYKHEKEIQLTKDSVVMGTYVTPSTANQPNSDGSKSSPSGRSGLVVSGTSVVASTTPPVNTNTNTSNPVTNTSEAEKAAKERAEREAAAKRLAEQAETERALAEKLRAEREAAERERIAREAAAKALAEKEHAERMAAAETLAEKERLEKERADREAAEALKAERERAEREAAEKARLEKEKSEREAAERAQAEKERAEREQAEKIRAEKEKAEKEKAEKEKAEKERAEKEAAEKNKADKEKAEKEKKEKIADPTIKSSDTLDVKDPVTICHIPPGNKANRRTLVISRSALKAHIGHGDIEGGCDGDKKDQKGKPQNSEKGKPQGGNKGKGPGADSKSLKHEDNQPAHALLYDAKNITLASAEKGPTQWLRYLDMQPLEGDTNKVYGTVKATLYHHTKTTTANGVVSFRIIDAKTGALLSVEKMPGEFVWISEWATFNGDERALSADQLKLTRLKELPAPPPQDLFIEFTRPIYNQITMKIREFYKGY